MNFAFPLRPLACLAAAGCLASVSGCAHPPSFVHKSKFLRSTFYRPATQQFIDSMDFSFEIDRRWKGPLTNPLGVVRYQHPRERATIDIVYLKEGATGWVESTKLEQALREKGAVEDSHVLDNLTVYKRPSKRARYTTYRYDPDFRLGEKPEVLLTEEIVVSDPEGYFLLRYGAKKDDFFRYYDEFNVVLASLVLAERKGEAQQDLFSGLRRKKTVGDTMQLAAMERDEKDRKERRRYLAGLQLGSARPLHLDSNTNFPRLLRPGYGANLHFVYFMRERLGVGAELSILQFPKRTEIDGTKTPPARTASEAQATVLSVTGRRRMYAQRRLNPYAALGAGYYTLDYKASPLALTSNIKSSGIALMGALGVEIPGFRRASFSLEARARRLLLGNTAFETLDVLFGTHYLF